MWRNVPKSNRPVQRFTIDDTYEDHYQGYKNFEGPFMAMFMPSSASRQLSLSDSGVYCLPALLAQYQRIMVLSAGRGVFWSEAIQHEIREVRDQRLLFNTVEEPPEWGIKHTSEWFHGYQSQMDGCGNCNPKERPWVTCMRC